MTSGIHNTELGVKLCLTGDAGVGKKYLLITFSSGSFPDALFPTLEKCEFSTNVNGRPVGFRAYVCPSHVDYDRRFRFASYYPGTDLFFVCFSIISLDSFNSVEDIWVPELREFCPEIPIVLVGLKTELRKDESLIQKMKEKCGRGPITYEEGVAKAKKIGAMRYMECSSRLGEGVNELFQYTLERILNGGKDSARCCLQ